MSDDLPQGWAIAPLKDAVQLLQNGPFGSLLHRSDYVEGGTPLINPANIVAGKLVPDLEITVGDDVLHRLASYVMRPGDVVVGRRGEMGRAALVTSDRPRWFCGTGCAFIRPGAAFDSKYLAMWFGSPMVRATLETESVGATMSNLSTRILGALEVRVPPLAEQRRIVAKVDALLARVNAARERLEKVPILLKRFRQSVLAKAFRGELVPTEADLAAGDGRTFESAARLLGQPDDDMSEELPKGWASAAASSVCLKVQSGGTPKKGFSTHGVPFLKVYNIVENRVSFDHRPQFVPLEVHEGELRKSVTLPGDVLMNIVGPPLNKVAIVPASLPATNINQAITLFRPGPAVSSSWLYYWLLTGSSVESLEFETKGSAGQVNISLSQCRNFVFPVAPVAEQRRIVAKVEALLALADSLEQAVERTRAGLGRAPQAILQRAFDGQLVPTEAELATAEGRQFESAEVLLSRLNPARADGDDRSGGRQRPARSKLTARSA